MRPPSRKLICAQLRKLGFGGHGRNAFRRAEYGDGVTLREGAQYSLGAPSSRAREPWRSLRTRRDRSHLGRAESKSAFSATPPPFTPEPSLGTVEQSEEGEKQPRGLPSSCLGKVGQTTMLAPPKLKMAATRRKRKRGGNLARLRP